MRIMNNTKPDIHGKGIFLVVLLLAFLPMTLFAATSMTDQWAFLNHYTPFVHFVADVKNAEPVDKVDQSYQAVLDSLPASDLQEVNQLMMHSKANTILARYYTEIRPKRNNDAKNLLKEANAILEKATALGVPESMALTQEADIDSIWYLISSMNISKGLNSTKLTDKAWELYPEEITVKVMMANRLLYAPAIGGGDTKRALMMFLELMETAQGQMAPWDMFSVYSGIGMACKKLGMDERAIQYLEVATQLYTGDSQIDEALAGLRK